MEHVFDKPGGFIDDDYAINRGPWVNEQPHGQRKIYLATPEPTVADDQPILPTILFDGKGAIAFNANARAAFGIRAESRLPIATPLELAPETQPCGGKSFQLASELLKQAVEQPDNAFIWSFRRWDNNDTFEARVELSKLAIGDQIIFCCILNRIPNTGKLQPSAETDDSEPYSLELKEQILNLQEKTELSSHSAALLMIGTPPFHSGQSDKTGLKSQLFIEMERRLKLTFRSVDRVFPCPDDTFAILLDHLDGEPLIARKQAKMVADRARDRLTDVYFLAPLSRDQNTTKEYRLRPCISIAVFTGKSETVQDIFLKTRETFERLILSDVNASDFVAELHNQ